VVPLVPAYAPHRMSQGNQWMVFNDRIESLRGVLPNVKLRLGNIRGRVVRVVMVSKIGLASSFRDRDHP
jgi:hypothetical protein